MIGGLLLLAAVQPPTALAPNIVPHVDDPAVEEFRCKVQDRAGKRQELAFRVVGGSFKREGERIVGREPRRIEVLSDDAGWLMRYPDQLASVRGIVNGEGTHDFGWTEPGGFSWGTRLFAYSFRWPKKFFVRLEGHRPDASFDALGFCDWSSTPAKIAERG